MHYLNLREDIENLEWEELYPGIIVYRNMLSNPNKAYDIMMNSESSSNGKYFFKEWTPWAEFGTYTQRKDEQEYIDAERGEIFQAEESLFQEIAVSYDKALSHYFKHTGIEIPEGATYSGQSWCKYFNKIDVLKNKMTMQYHTDYVISQSEMPGQKFHTTCTFYINDNYNGGDIEFYVNGDITNHKPKAGDLVIFPSTPPFFHGVKTIPDGNKFFIRNFVMHEYAGSEEWLANQRKHGAVKWGKMELERLQEDVKTTMLYLQGDKIVEYKDVAEKDLI